MKPVRITEDELEYYSTPDTLNEGNEGILSKEETDKLLASEKWYTIEEFSAKIDETIRRKIPNP